MNEDLIKRLRNCREGEWTPLLMEAADQLEWHGKEWERLKAKVAWLAKKAYPNGLQMPCITDSAEGATRD